MPNFWLLIFAASISQGLFLSVGIGIKERWKNPALNLLNLLILSFTITLAYYLTFWLGYASSLPRITGLIMQFTFLFGLLLFLYFKKVKKENTKKAWLHFAPFVIAVTSLFFFYNTGIETEVNFIIIVSQNLQLIGYSAYFIFKENRKDLRPLTIAFSAYSLSFLSYYTLVWTGLLQIQYDYMISASMALFIYYLGYKGLQTKQLSPERPAEKYSNSSLTKGALAYLLDRLDKVMMEEKLFIDGDLKLQGLSEKLEVSVHSLSQAINEGKNQKFNDYLNELRVEEAKRLMLSASHKDLKLIAIALDSVFNNKTSFLNAFKRITGMNPSQFREKLIAQAS